MAELTDIPCAICGSMKYRKERGVTYCRTCNNRHAKKYREANKAKISERDRRYRRENPEKIRIRSTSWLYGVSLEEAVRLRAIGSCDSCGTDTPGGKGGFHIDHDHDSGKVRGVLCHGCNVSLGQLDEDPDRIKALLRYLERFK